MSQEKVKHCPRYEYMRFEAIWYVCMYVYLRVYVYVYVYICVCVYGCLDKLTEIEQWQQKDKEVVAEFKRVCM